MRVSSPFAAALLAVATLPALATVFATVHGVVHDPQHRPIAGAQVTLQAADSAFTFNATTNPQRRIRSAAGADRRLPAENCRHGVCAHRRAAHPGLRHQPSAAYPALHCGRQFRPCASKGLRTLFPPSIR